jgi:hypothetical protein
MLICVAVKGAQSTNCSGDSEKCQGDVTNIQGIELICIYSNTKVKTIKSRKDNAIQRREVLAQRGTCSVSRAAIQ